MTKETYESRIYDVESYTEGGGISRQVAMWIAEEADQEIKKLKELLKFSLYYVQESGMCNILAAKIEEALNDE